MALTYSLKYKKLNAYNRVLLEKEGEVVIDRQSFRLKGKGAQDMGESIYFGDMKSMSVKDDYLAFSTFTKDRYILSDFANLFDSFLKDFSRVRNEYLSDSLFMKVGMLYHEYEGQAEIVNSAGKIINKGRTRIQFYEGSIVFIPEVRECFVTYLDFLKGHEFDEDDYLLKLYLDNGSTVNISKLGTTFEDAQQTLESLLSKMYERVINNLKEVLPDFDAATLLKLAYKLKGGRALPYVTLKKIHEDMPARLLDLAFKNNPVALEKVQHLRKMGTDENFYLGFSFSQNLATREVMTRSWFIYGLPEKNTVAFGMTASPNDTAVYFFRIVMQQGEAKEKLPAKVLEIDQSLVLFRFDLTPVYKDRRELRKSRYKTAVKKLAFLRLLRKSLLMRQINSDIKTFEESLERIFASSATAVPAAAPPAIEKEIPAGV
jgi:hypothetical protein